MSNHTLVLAALALSLCASAGWAGDCCTDKPDKSSCAVPPPGDLTAPGSGGDCCGDKPAAAAAPATPADPAVTPAPAGPTVDQAFNSGIRTVVPLGRFSRKSKR